MNLKIKALLVLVFMLIIINNVSAYETYSGTFESTGSSQTTQSTGYQSGNQMTINGIGLKDGGLGKYLTDVTAMMTISAWNGGTEIAYYKDNVTYHYDGEQVGEGYMYFWLQNTDEDPEYEYVYVKAHINDGLDLTSGAKVVTIEGDIVTTYMKHKRQSSANMASGGYNEKCGLLGAASVSPALFPVEAVHKAFHTINFYNSYEYYYNDYEDLFTYNLYRNSSNPSMLSVYNGYQYLIDETSTGSSDISIYSDDLTNHSWNVELIDSLSMTHYLDIDFNPEEEDLTPTLTTDKTEYNTSETITISYTNIDEYYNSHSYNSHSGYKYEKPYTLYILYPVSEVGRDYRAKFYQPLYYDLRDENFTLNTSFLQPQNDYILGIVADIGDFEQEEDLLIVSDMFHVYPANEYIETSCNPSSNCNVGNGDKIEIYYSIINNSNICIKDDEGNTVSVYYGVSGTGLKHYQIPLDENKLNKYPNWKVYLNNTEYETSYNTDLTVYWNLFATPKPTVTPIIETPDENITEQIDTLKDETKPLLDFIYGLSTILVDNPDYDKSNFVDEDELNIWFNSLIPLVIVLLIYCLYVGLKKRG